jgi:hypothetical protein
MISGIIVAFYEESCGKMKRKLVFPQIDMAKPDGSGGS